jgi:hypothetical protein
MSTDVSQENVAFIVRIEEYVKHGTYMKAGGKRLSTDYTAFYPRGCNSS